MTSGSLGFVVCRCECKLRRKQNYQGGVAGRWGPQICSFTAGGGVSVVSLIGSVGVCEAASQCGDVKGSVLPMGSFESQEIGCVCVCETQ